MDTRRRMAGLVAACAVTAALAGAGGVAWSNHNFSDVGDGSFFGPSINAGAAAGCFNGFPDGTFKGNRNATRNQFAFWLNNCGATVARVIENGAVGIPGDLPEPVAIASIDIEVKGSGTQFVELAAQLYSFTNELRSTVCESADPCGLLFVWGENGSVLTDSAAVDRIDTDRDLDSLTLRTMVQATAGSHTYDLVVFPPAGVKDDQEIEVADFTLTARTAPFVTEQPAVPASQADGVSALGGFEVPDTYPTS